MLHRFEIHSALELGTSYVGRTLPNKKWVYLQISFVDTSYVHVSNNRLIPKALSKFSTFYGSSPITFKLFNRKLKITKEEGRAVSLRIPCSLSIANTLLTLSNRPGKR